MNLQNAALALLATSSLLASSCTADSASAESPEQISSATPSAPAASSPAAVPVAEPTAQESRPATKSPVFDATHALWTEILAEHVQGDNFDYEALKKKPERLERYLEQLQAVTPAEYEAWKEDDQMAFWINVYNANAIHLVIENYPVKSIRDIGTMLNRVWNKRFIEMPAFDPEGKDRKLSLDDVEHKILRPTFQDARVHAAVNCASGSCPPLRAEAFTGKKLSDQLNEQVRLWLADTSRNQIDQAKNEVRISKIFDWFKDDFKNPRGGTLDWIAAYLPSDQSEWLRANAKKIKVRYLDYSWKLNDVKK